LKSPGTVYVSQSMPLPAPFNPLRRRRAFTLTELLVVIAVTAILLAILLTVFHSAIKFVRALRG
jgi:prepilin-type N-terminal cleavage/methylation domain-containing protein